MSLISRINVRTFVLGALTSTLLLSLVCSASIRYGHADVPVAATAADVKPLGDGDSAPHFTVEDVEGAPFDFDPRKLDRPAILVSFRGGWCPYCNMHLSELRHAVPAIRDMGIDVFFLSGDRPELLYAGLSGEARDDIGGLDYTILSDANAQAAMALGIAFKASARTIGRLGEKGKDIAQSSMERQGVLPVPAVFAVDRDGVIAFAFVNADYKIRLPADELVAVARELTSAN